MHETDSMKEALSDFSQNVRSQTRTINIKVTFISWIVEFVTGITFLLFTRFGNVRFRPYYTLLYVTSMGVFVPFTYIINRDVTKEKILLRGWNNGIRSIFTPDTRVAPVEEPNVIPLRNMSSEPQGPRASNSNSGNEMTPNTSQTTADSTQEIDPMPVRNDPQLEVPGRILTYSSKTIQPIILPIISGNTDRDLENTLATPANLITRIKSTPHKSNPETTESS